MTSTSLLPPCMGPCAQPGARTHSLRRSIVQMVGSVGSSNQNQRFPSKQESIGQGSVVDKTRHQAPFSSPDNTPISIRQQNLSNQTNTSLTSPVASSTISECSSEANRVHPDHLSRYSSKDKENIHSVNGCTQIMNNSQYELHGKSIGFRNPKQKSAPRVGVLSASFEAFKRRLKLRVSSSKHSNVVYGQDAEKVNNYILMGDGHVLAEEMRGVNDTFKLPKSHETFKLPISNDKHLTRSILPLGHDIIAKNQNTSDFVYREKAKTKSSINSSSYQNTNECPNRKDAPLNQSHPDTYDNSCDVFKEHAAQENDVNKTDVSTHFSYRLHNNSTLENEYSTNMDTKRPLTNVMTYAVEHERDIKSRSRSNPTREVPLTMHNLQQHDSLSAIADTREQLRLSCCRRVQQMVKGSAKGSVAHNMTPDSDSMYSNRDRMLRWLADIRVHATSSLEAGSTVLPSLV